MMHILSFYFDVCSIFLLAVLTGTVDFVITLIFVHIVYEDV